MKGKISQIDTLVGVILALIGTKFMFFSESHGAHVAGPCLILAALFLLRPILKSERRVIHVRRISKYID